MNCANRWKYLAQTRKMINNKLGSYLGCGRNRERQQFHGVDVELVTFLVGSCNYPLHHLNREILTSKQKISTRVS
jgi:hypothetical protein